MVDFNVREFAKEVIYDLHSKEGRKRFVYDDGTANVTEKQQAVIKQAIDNGTWDMQKFQDAIVEANQYYARDFVEGQIEPTDIPSGNSELNSALNDVREIGNEDVLDSPKEFVRLALEDEIPSLVQGASLAGFRAVDAVGRKLDEPAFTIRTKASWVENYQAKASAISHALKGDFKESTYSIGLDGFANRKAYDSPTRALKSAAKALRGDIKDYLADNPPEPKVGLSAVADRAAKPGIS